MDIKPERLKALLKDMVDIYSPSGKEGEILKYLERYLKRHDISVVRQGVDEDRYNLVVFPGQGNRAGLCFVGHLDTVAAFDLDSYELREDGDKLYGLGTVDMKGGCAAMIEAFIALNSGSRMPDIGLALVVDEEVDSKGAKALVGGYSFPWAVIGEPTGMAPCLDHYGYLELNLRTVGKRAHSSMPETGHNAIESMLGLLKIIAEYATSAPAGLVYNIRQLTSHPSGFVVPDFCEAWMDFHFPPGSTVDAVKSGLEATVESAGQDIAGLDAQLKFEDMYEGYRLPRRDSVVDKLREAYRNVSLPWKAQNFRSHSDGNVLKVAGVNPIMLGPGVLEAAHTSDEAVSFNQVLQAARLYLEFALLM
jgi:acetylornithine deacetylase